MSLVEKHFLWFLRAGLWGLTRDGSCEALKSAAPSPDEEFDWGGIFSLAKRQTVLLLVEDGVEAWMQWLRENEQTIPEIPAIYLLKIENLRDLAREQHAMQDKMLQRACGLLQQDGITPYLLKGESLALLYPQPFSRVCGDIDLYVDPEDFKRAKRLLSSVYDTIGRVTDKHCTFKEGRLKLELHWQAMSLGNPFARKAFQTYSRESLSSMQPSRCSLPLSGYQVAVPPLQFNLIFVLAHLFHHFIEGGVGLRQLCDWAVLLQHASSETTTVDSAFDLSELRTRLEKFSLMQAWQIFGNIAVRYLGIPVEKMPFYLESCSSSADRCLSIILTEGNFGRYGKGKYARRKSDSYSQRKSKALRLTSKRLWRKSVIFPWDVLYYLPTWVAESFSRLFKHQ